MKSPLENKNTGDSNPDKVRDKLVEKALKTLTLNIEYADQKEPQNLKDKLLKADQNPLRLARGEVLQNFDAVQVEGHIGASDWEGSVFMKPYLSHKDVQHGQTRVNVQPMGINLNILERDKEKRIELAEGIWSGVSLEEKVAIALKYIDWKKATEENGLAAMPEIIKTGDFSVHQTNDWSEQHKRYIKILSELETAIKQGSFTVEINDQDASLIFSPKKENK